MFPDEISRLLFSAGLSRRHYAEILTVSGQLRPFGLLHIPRQNAKIAEVLLSNCGCKIQSTRYLLRKDDPTSYDGVLADSSPDQANFVEYVFSGSQLGLGLPDLEMGALLSYPECCRNEWMRHQSQGVLYNKYLCDEQPLAWEVNRLVLLFEPDVIVPDFFPCSLHCQNAVSYSRAMLELARTHLPVSWIAKSEEWLKAMMCIHEQHLLCFPRWQIIGGDCHLSVNEAIKMPIADITAYFRSDSAIRKIRAGHVKQVSRVILSVEGKAVAEI
jgi:hypothetical protein